MIVDTVVWIALKYQRDKYHRQARKLFPELIKTKKLFVSDYIIIETYAFLLRKVSSEVAIETLEMFKNSNQIQIINNDFSTFENTYQILKKYKSLSYTDANIVYLMRKNKINEVYSYNDGFDGINGITRVF